MQSVKLRLTLIKSRLKNIIIFCLILFVSGCTTGSFKKRLLHIDKGMNINEAVRILGPPKDKQFNGDLEAWQWCSTGTFIDSFSLLWVEDGLIIGKETYQNEYNPFYNGLCSGHIKHVKWQDKPNQLSEETKLEDH